MTLYVYGETLTPFETAKSGEVADEFRAIQSAFEALDTLMSRFLQVLESVPTIPQDASLRAGKILGFDPVTGNPIAVLDFSDGSLIFPVAIELGGTGADNAVTALNNLGGVPTTRLVNSGNGLAGGGALSSDRTFSLDTSHPRNVDHSTVNVNSGTGLTGGGNITASRTLALNASNPMNVDHSTISIGAGAGLSGGGTIDADRTLTVGEGAGINVLGDSVALDLTHPANVDHSDVSIFGGIGLSGGGPINVDQTLNLNFNQQPTIGANVVDGAADYLLVRDASVDEERRVLVDNIISTGSQIGYRGIPGTLHNATYALVLTDMGRMLKHTSGTAHAWTIPPNSSVAFPADEAAIGMLNMGTGVVTITQGAGVTLRLAGTTVTGNLELAQWGQCLIYQATADTWFAQGTGLSPA